MANKVSGKSSAKSLRSDDVAKVYLLVERTDEYDDMDIDEWMDGGYGDETTVLGIYSSESLAKENQKSVDDGVGVYQCNVREFELNAPPRDDDDDDEAESARPRARSRSRVVLEKGTKMFVLLEHMGESLDPDADDDCQGPIENTTILGVYTTSSLARKYRKEVDKDCYGFMYEVQEFELDASPLGSEPIRPPALLDQEGGKAAMVERFVYMAVNRMMMDALNQPSEKPGQTAESK